MPVSAAVGKHDQYHAILMELVEQVVRKSPRAAALNDLDLMMYAFEDYQIVLSHSIPAKRIVKVLPQGDAFGRIIKSRKQQRLKYGISWD
ncbi:hypothetical protein [Taibaiella soli]|uniref:Uncharacterized protein n=1 Tax=Taibaiella soli TaxID=1649169 RepID=A0A2W2C139_9BACT|nr:hypothetical protein [Taibaiella soli]PZF73733.1 hypothetical protein DN068_06980 [Taibaiella soli]